MRSWTFQTSNTCTEVFGTGGGGCLRGEYGGVGRGVTAIFPVPPTSCQVEGPTGVWHSQQGPSCPHAASFQTPDTSEAGSAWAMCTLLEASLLFDCSGLPPSVTFGPPTAGMEPFFPALALLWSGCPQCDLTGHSGL